MARMLLRKRPRNLYRARHVIAHDRSSGDVACVSNDSNTSAHLWDGRRGCRAQSAYHAEVYTDSSALCWLSTKASFHTYTWVWSWKRCAQYSSRASIASLKL
eukprot:scaffold463_cov351-Prasinococcus_capsulatus_cf.AAC.3